MSCREKLATLLRDAGVRFEVQHHPPAYSARDVALSEHVPPRLVAKVVIVIAKGTPVMPVMTVILVIPAHERLCMEAVEEVLGSSVRLATEPELAVLFPDCQVGTMPPFGAPYDVPVYVDEDLTRDKTFYFQSGSYTETMSVRYADYARLAQPTVGRLSYCLLPAASGV